MSRLTYANVVSTIALFCVLGGGAYAVGKLEENEVKSKHIKVGAVKNSDLGDNAVTSPKVANGSLLAEDFGAGQIPEGAQGPAGPNGDTGSQGPTGSQGQTGSQGLQGEPGWKDDCVSDIPGDVMVKVGSVCIDRYEVSVWSAPSGGTQYGVSSDNYPCNDNGQNCTGATAIYARSVAGVTPSRFITYFQAQQALANSQKRLPSNAEWQMAVAGTPDPGIDDNGTTDCNVASTLAVANTGSRPACVSNYGANDMVGNLYEWVADWVPHSNACGSWPAGYGFDEQCLAGAATIGAPGALVRGASFDFGTDAGPFAVNGVRQPSDSNNGIGFRGAR